MSAKIKYEGGNLYVLRFSGVLRRAELDAGQTVLGREIEAGAKPLLLVILEEFKGWEKGADWNDVEFMLTRGTEIAKIAIVGEPRWETGAMAFAGAGFRRAPVKFFPSDQQTAARAWLAA